MSVQPENRIHRTVINEANLVRLQLKTFMLADPVSNLAIKELFLRGISLTNFDVTLALHDIKNPN